MHCAVQIRYRPIDTELVALLGSVQYSNMKNEKYDLCAGGGLPEKPGSPLRASARDETRRDERRATEVLVRLARRRRAAPRHAEAKAQRRDATRTAQSRAEASCSQRKLGAARQLIDVIRQ